jgi:CubicO group peptidase (beta-lactamase class C family)
MFATALACLLSLPVQDRVPQAERERIANRLEALADERLINGELEYAAIAVELRGRRLGLFPIVETVPAPTLDTPIAAAPVGRLLLAATALVEIGAGRAALDAELSDLLPELGELGEGRDLSQLLARTSGLPSLPALPEGASLEPAELLALLAPLAPHADPETCVHFEPMDDLALGLVLERASGRSVRALVDAHLFEPLGIENAWAPHPEDDPLAPPALVTSSCEFGAMERAEARELDLFGWRSLQLTPDQLLELWDAYLGGAFGGSKLTEAAFSPRRLTADVGPDHGFRVHRTELGDLAGWMHGGSFDEAHVHLVSYPEVELRIAILGRGAEADLAGLGRYAARAVLDLPEPRAVDLPLTADRRWSFEGEYQVGCDILTIGAREQRLYLERATASTPLAYRGGDVLSALEDPELRLEFRFGRDGRALEFVLDDHGQVAIATRVR